MRRLDAKWAINLDVTTVCGQGCLYCSRYSRHLRPDMVKDMPLEMIEGALISYQGFPGRIGITGGEPVFHKQFPEVCRLLRKYFPPDQLTLFCANRAKLEEYAPIVNITFGLVCFNEHNDRQKAQNLHQPATVAIGEVVPPEVAEQLIDDCWVQRTWCGTVTHHGAYFCEMAGHLDLLLNDGKNAWPVTPRWWDIEPEAFESQKHLCQLCGMAVPMKRDPLCQPFERFTPNLLKMFKDRGLSRLADNEISLTPPMTKEEVEQAIPTWTPGNYRGDLQADECCREGLGFTKVLKWA